MNNDINNNNNNNNNNLEGQVLGSTNTSNGEVIDNLFDESQNPQTIEQLAPPNPVNYTSVDSLNQNAHFQRDTSIGVNPPVNNNVVNNQQYIKEKPKKKNKLLFIILIVILILGIGAGTYYVLMYTDLIIKKDNINIITKTFELNLGETLPDDMDSYATITGTDKNNCSKDILNINVNKEGSYNYTITCGNLTKDGTVNVVDNSDLVVNTKNVYITKDGKVEATDFIKQVDANVNYEFVSTEEVNNFLAKGPGEYVINIKATKGTKEANVTAKLVIMEYAIKGYLSCSSNEQNMTDSSGVMVETEKFVINDNNNSFSNISEYIYTFKYSDESEFNRIFEENKNKREITIYGINGSASYDKDNLIITIIGENELQKIKEKYGETSLANYSSILTYFRDTLGYKCRFEK